MLDSIKSQEFLKPKFRLPHQTTSFIYRALDVAEEQIIEQQRTIEKLKKDNRRLSLLSKRKKTRKRFGRTK